GKFFFKKYIKKGVEVVSDGTDNHLLLINVKSSYNITGKEAENFLEKINITINKNSITFYALSPVVTSGIRLGTASMTSRNFTNWEELAEIIDYSL
ncbi:serine hydroxymethyltransferase, partial [Mycoplasmopsis synoviae]